MQQMVRSTLPQGWGVTAPKGESGGSPALLTKPWVCEFSDIQKIEWRTVSMVLDGAKVAESESVINALNA